MKLLLTSDNLKILQTCRLKKKKIKLTVDLLKFTSNKKNIKWYNITFTLVVSF